jgi:AraC family transcriptional regulator
MKSLIALVLFIVVGLVGTLMYRLGSFKPVVITEAIHGPTKVIYKLHVGAYHQIVPTIEEVEKWAKAHGEPCTMSFGEYYNNPDKVAEDRLRSNGGCVVEKSWDTGLPDGFAYREIPVHVYVVATFDGAPSIGPIKVYPKVGEFKESHGYDQPGPTYEFYEIRPGNQVRTTYMFPVIKRGDRDANPVYAKDYAP